MPLNLRSPGYGENYRHLADHQNPYRPGCLKIADLLDQPFFSAVIPARFASFAVAFADF